MTVEKIKNSILKSFSVFSFKYKEKIGGIDPISDTEFILWYDNDDNVIADSIDKAIMLPVFDGKSLTELVNKKLITKHDLIESNF